jgi:hypothetical protein
MLGLLSLGSSFAQLIFRLFFAAALFSFVAAEEARCAADRKDQNER